PAAAPLPALQQPGKQQRRKVRQPAPLRPKKQREPERGANGERARLDPLQPMDEMPRESRIVKNDGCRSHAQHFYRYRMEFTPMPVRNYAGEFRIDGNPESRSGFPPIEPAA